MIKKTIFSMLFIALLVTSCKEDVDLITPDLDLIERVKSTEILLRNNTWKFDDLMVEVKYYAGNTPVGQRCR